MENGIVEIVATFMLVPLSFTYFFLQEDNTMVDILPSRKIDSHIKPFSGDLVANQEGVYTLVFDNTFSMLV